MGGRALGRALLALKVPIWDDAGQTKVSYYGPPRCCLLRPDAAAAIDPITDALIAP